MDYRGVIILCPTQGSERLPAVTSKADPKNGYVKGNQAMADVQPKASEMVSWSREVCRVCSLHELN